VNTIVRRIGLSCENSYETTLFRPHGASGCGKTSVGQRLAERLGWGFYDADDFHPPVNIAKMASGIPLAEEGRAPWLDSLRDYFGAHTYRRMDREGGFHAKV
jgi:gluconokinase